MAACSVHAQRSLHFLGSFSLSLFAELSSMSTSTSSPSRVPSSGAGPLGSWRQALPNIIVFGLLAGVFYLGHHTGWKLPSRSELFGGESVVADDWCAEHLVPETNCVECNAELFQRSKKFGFCWTHGVAECVIDHPELAQVSGEPQLPKYDTAAAIALMSRAENNSRNTMHERLIQFASAASAEKAGVDIDVVSERPMSDVISASGELAFDPRRVAHLSAKVPGTVALVVKNVGDEVRAGDVLALVDAAQVGQAKANLLQAVVQVDLRESTVKRLQGVVNSGALPGKALIEAQAAHQEAQIDVISGRQALTNLGLEPPEGLEGRNATEVSNELRFLSIPPELAQLLPEGMKTANLLPLRAPYDGVVVSSEVVAGEVVSSSDLLFTVADPRRLWLILNLRQEDAKYVKRGLPVRFQADDGSQAVNGEVAWISPAVDEQTRTLQVRVTVDNADGALRDKTFGAGGIVLREEQAAIVVPAAAVQSTTDAQFVFVRDKNYMKPDAPKLFHVRQVRTGARDGEFVELLAGALPGEVVAAKGSAVLMAQLLRSNLGAGCGCYDD
jgi:cobalt-zinc-cadmium efflux system membrane fusion protein